MLPRQGRPREVLRRHPDAAHPPRCRHCAAPGRPQHWGCHCRPRRRVRPMSTDRGPEGPGATVSAEAELCSSAAARCVQVPALTPAPPCCLPLSHSAAGRAVGLGPRQQGALLDLSRPLPPDSELLRHPLGHGEDQWTTRPCPHARTPTSPFPSGAPTHPTSHEATRAPDRTVALLPTPSAHTPPL